jgi:hypothetical protein
LQYFLLAVLTIIFTIIFFNKPKSLIFVQLLYCAFMEIIIDSLHAPQIIQYFADYINLLLFFNLILCNRSKLSILKYLKLPLVIIGLTILLNLVSSIANQSGLLHFIWGFRINMRFILIFIAAVVFMEEKDKVNLKKVLYLIFVIQIIVCSIQFFILNLRQDSVGGTFGLHGTNLITTLSAMLLIFVFCLYQNRQASLITFFLVLFMGLFISTIGEGKAIIFFDALVILCILLFSRKFSTKLAVTILSVISIMMAIQIIGSIYAGFTNFFQIGEIIKYSSLGVYGDAGINRFNGVPIINQFISPLQQWIGTGLGNAANSQFSALLGEYYIRLQNLKVDWFAYSYYYLEDGFIGLALYIAFFVSCLISYMLLAKKIHSKGNLLEITIALICISSVFFSSIIKTEYLGYMMYVFLALPFAFLKDVSGEEKTNAVSKYYRSGL